jgi:hypothetical protein
MRAVFETRRKGKQALDRKPSIINAFALYASVRFIPL